MSPNYRHEDGGQDREWWSARRATARIITAVRQPFVQRDPTTAERSEAVPMHRRFSHQPVAAENGPKRRDSSRISPYQQRAKILEGMGHKQASAIPHLRTTRAILGSRARRSAAAVPPRTGYTGPNDPSAATSGFALGY